MLKTAVIARNATFYVVALSLQKVVSFVYFSYLARSLGAQLTGKYFFATSIAAVAIVIMDLGLSSLLTREVAKSNERLSQLVSQVVTIKVLLAVLAGAAIFVSSALFISDGIIRHLIYIAFIIAIFDSFSLTFFGGIRAHQNLFYESLGAIFFQIIVMALGVTFITLHFDVRVILTALLAASAFNFAYSLIILRTKLGLRLRPDFNRHAWFDLARLVWPFALAAVFVKVYAYIDTIFLKFFVSDTAVGLYSVAYKLTFAFQFIPLAFVAALYPAFSYFWQNDRASLHATFSKACQYLLIISLPIVFGTYAVAPRLISDVYTTSYGGSTVPLLLLISSLPFLFLNFPIGSLLNACDRQRRQTWHLGVTMVVNILLNLLLIPLWGPSGAALASLMSTVFIFGLGMYVVRQVSDYNRRLVFFTSLKLLIICVVMLLLVLWLQAYILWYLAAIVAVVFYLAAAFGWKVLTSADISSLKTMIKR